MNALFDSLEDLTMLHSTPGDESAVALMLVREWKEAGWQTAALGRYAVYAKSPDWQPGRPTVMFCAHADSPGFIIQSINDDGSGCAVKLGGPHATDSADDAILLKGRDGLYEGVLEKVDVGETDPLFFVRADGHTPERGDRICFMPCFRLVHEGGDGDGDFVKASFLDNRVGCWALLRVAWQLKKEEQAVNVILAATAEEEMTGFGADVLAKHVEADMVVCLDATYVDDAQGIAFGEGPVLTVSDKSTLLSPDDCQAVSAVFRQWRLPLQMEIYNFSGTDARSFPSQGCCCPVLALLVPTKGNHSPVETAAVKDLLAYEQMCLQFCRDGSATTILRSVWNRWERLAR